MSHGPRPPVPEGADTPAARRPAPRAAPTATRSEPRATPAPAEPITSTPAPAEPAPTAASPAADARIADPLAAGLRMPGPARAERSSGPLPASEPTAPTARKSPRAAAGAASSVAGAAGAAASSVAGAVPRGVENARASMSAPTGAQVLLSLLPFALMVVAASADAFAGPSVGLLPLLSLGPAFAAVSGGLRQVLVVGAVALLLCTGLASYDKPGDLKALIAFVTIAGVIAAGVVAGAGRRRRERELADVRAIAEVAQRVVLRPLPENAAGVTMAVRYISATARADIGGDLYEVVSTARGMRVIVGDVQGKGLAAVKTAATVLGAFREAAYDAADLEAISRRVEASLARHLADEEFATAILAEVAEHGATVELLNCGHPPPLLVRQDGAAVFVEPEAASLPLGLAGLADVPRTRGSVPLEPGDQLLLYTDGVGEARNRAGDYYPLDRCGPLLGGDMGASLDALRDDVVAHVGHALDDDAAMLLIRRDPR